jgi:hypothetical protein
MKLLLLALLAAAFGLGVYVLLPAKTIEIQVDPPDAEWAASQAPLLTWDLRDFGGVQSGITQKALDAACLQERKWGGRIILSAGIWHLPVGTLKICYMGWAQ